ncbi:BS ykrK family protein [Furfurilactobacillus rossiae]|uniref:DUF1836 domain-containing protein n=1 Tax=Furfurilactobacillus rossiae TaxID=231049 RepID=UPI0015BB7745|nr:DUF1836 domain-containing protein [Furfurilactobacillus rossiae]MCF6166357.1 DUF1836 domain-containing protein [Furfurilactobacillus rossiae]QLE65074.1 BS ykrK family protein [Furfurilactobacillus rossiae]
MADSFNDYHKWEQHLAEVKLPKWDELPKFDLYMDQVVAYVNDTLGPLDVDSVTPAMINNYVKHNIILAPVKKKYQVMQVADILLIGLLKPTYSMDTIRQGMDQVTTSLFPKRAYDTFIDLMLAGLQGTLSTDAATNLNDQMMKIAVNAVLDKMKSEKLLALTKEIVKPKPVEQK